MREQQQEAVQEEQEGAAALAGAHARDQRQQAFERREASVVGQHRSRSSSGDRFRRS